jgi:hypothetical protein
MKFKKTSKRLLLRLIVACLLVGNATAQSQPFQEGTTVINAGFGVLSSIGYYSGVSRSPVLSLSGEYGVKKLGPGILGLGLAIGYQSASYSLNSGPYYYKDKWATTIFGIRGTYHPDFLCDEKYEVYGVLQLTFDHFGYKFSSNDPYYNTNLYGRSNLSNSIRPYLMIGGRYYFTKSFGAFAELGYDISYLKLGLCLAFNKSASEPKK